jgi:hypothetical protein
MPVEANRPATVRRKVAGFEEPGLYAVEVHFDMNGATAAEKSRFTVYR